MKKFRFLAFILLIILIGCQVSVIRINGNSNYVTEQEKEGFKADSVKVNAFNKKWCTQGANEAWINIGCC